MGREEKRLRKRVTRQLERRLHRQPTDDELDQAIADLQETQRKAGAHSAGRDSGRR